MVELEVLGAIEAVEQVRRLLDRTDLSDASAHTWVRYEVAMLRHWAEALRERPSDYVALGEGLAEFADGCERTLAAMVPCP
jgi:hypothetical protein